MINKFRKGIMGFVLVTGLGLSSGVHATLIGDTVDVIHYFPDLDTVHNVLGPTTGAVGLSDVVTYSGIYDVDLEADSIQVDFLSQNSWSASAFNGLIVASIDDIVTNVSIDTNMLGWDNSRLGFNASALAFNWNSLSFTTDTYFNAYITTSSVPEPGILALISLGLVGFGFRRKRQA